MSSKFSTPFMNKNPLKPSGFGNKKNVPVGGWNVSSSGGSNELESAVEPSLVVSNKKIKKQFTNADEIAGQAKGWEESMFYDPNPAYPGEDISHTPDFFYQKPAYYQDLSTPFGDFALGDAKIRMLNEDGTPRYVSDYILTDDGEVPSKAFVAGLDKGQLSNTYQAPDYKGFKKLYGFDYSDPMNSSSMNPYTKSQIKDQKEMKRNIIKK